MARKSQFEMIEREFEETREFVRSLNSETSELVRRLEGEVCRATNILSKEAADHEARISRLENSRPLGRRVFAFAVRLAAFVAAGLCLLKIWPFLFPAD